MADRTVAQWVEYTQTLHNRSIDLSLDRVIEVRDRLNLNPLSCRSIAVAGTNGKGSTVAMLESIYAAAGYRTACYTSPHLVRYNERIRIDGDSVQDQHLLPAFEAVERARQSTPLTYFEFGTLVAASVIDSQKVDIALLEVGLGGRLDAVKVLSADLSIITSIGIDHQAWLGPDRETIGREKAGIMHVGSKAVCAETRCPQSIIDEAEINDVDLWRIGKDFGFDRIDDPENNNGWRWWCKHDGATPVDLPQPALAGSHQYYNAAGVVAAVQRLQSLLPVAPDSLASGLQRVCLAGRLQQIGVRPMRIVDVAHNVEAVLELRAYLDNHPVEGRTLLVAGMLEDKPVAECLDVLAPVVDEWFLSTLDVERGLTADKLNNIVTSRLPEALTRCFDDPVRAWGDAAAKATDIDRIVAFGSFHTVGDILQHLQQLEILEKNKT